jgi:hypothetical protein
MARLQWCREHIDEVQKACGLSKMAVKEVEAAAKFCIEHNEFSSLPTAPILALIRVKDEQVRAKAILSVQKQLELPKNSKTGRFSKTITEKEVKKIIEKAEIEVRNVEIERIRAERDAEEARTGIKSVSQDEINTMLGVAEELPKKEDPKEEMVPAATITKREIDIYFTVMRKILCEEDIPKHRKRMDMMIANKTLVVKEK